MDIISGAGEKVATTAWESVCKSFAEAAASLLGEFAKAFVAIPPVDLNSGGVRSAYGVSLGIAGLIAGLLVLGQVIRTALTHDGSPAAQAIVGLGKALMAFVLTLTIGATALRAADELTQWIVIRTFGSTEAMTKRIGEIVQWNQGISATLLLVLAIIGILLTIVLWFELLLRNAAIAVLVATSPIAAAGQTSDATKHWWSKLVSATVQLIILKPVIALVFCLGFSMTGQATDVPSLLAGMLVLLLAVVAWPAIARFFTFASVHVGGGAGLGALLGFAAGRGMSGEAGPTSGVDPGDFSKSAEARTMSAIGERTGAQPFGNGAMAGKAVGAAAATGAATGGAAAALGPVGMAVLGAQMAQRATNALTGRMEGMAGHAGIPGANPYAQPAGYSMRQQRPVNAPRQLEWPEQPRTGDGTAVQDQVTAVHGQRETAEPEGELLAVGPASGSPGQGAPRPANTSPHSSTGPLPTAQQLYRGGLFPGEVQGEEVPLPAAPPPSPEEVPPPPVGEAPAPEPLPTAEQLIQYTSPGPGAAEAGTPPTAEPHRGPEPGEQQ